MSTLVAKLRHAWATWWSPIWEADSAPFWAHAVVTFVISSGIAVVFTAFALLFGSGRDPWSTWWKTLLVSQCIGFSIQGLFQLAGALLGAARINALGAGQRIVFFSAVPLLGVLIGQAVGLTLLGVDVGRLFSSGRFFAMVLLVWVLLTVVWWRFFAVKLRLADAERTREAARAHAAVLERQATDAQLRALQAQIEPHFLFNTLANVVSLIDAQPPAARQMLERLIDLLRGSLSASRAQHATLGQELDLVRAYLDIQAIRMGPRLAVEVDAAADVRVLPVPPLLLQPLVENAIAHGLEPKIEGGRIRVTAALRDGGLELVVEDNGVGFGALTRGGGVGLPNLRARLATQYDGQAHLAIEDARPGTRVRLQLPAAAASDLRSSVPSRPAHA
jgi:hypothetical protein